jgi:hypothetical protein
MHTLDVFSYLNARSSTRGITVRGLTSSRAFNCVTGPVGSTGTTVLVSVPAALKHPEAKPC